MVRVEIEGQLLSDTPKIKGLNEIIEVNSKLNSWVRSFGDAELVLYGDGYNIIKNLRDANGYNYRASVRIIVTPDGGLAGTGDVLNAYLYLTDIEIDHTFRQITAPLVELHFEGSLEQNQKVEAYLLNTPTSINGETNNIAAFVGTRLGLKLFNPLTGTHDANARYGVEISSALQFIIKYITDNGMDYQDNYFSVNWTEVQFCLITGRELRAYAHDQSDRPIQSFESIITNLYKIFNIWWYIDYSTPTPTFVLDDYDVIFNDPASVQVDILSIKNIKERFNQDSFFTDIEIGTKTYITPYDTSNSYLPFYNGFTHHFESFHGKNNTMNSQTLDLVSDWIMDHNVIAKIYNTGTTDYDDQHFLIECENVGFLDDPALEYTYGVSDVASERRYNENLLNYNRLARFSLPVNVGFDIDVTGDGFEAVLSADVDVTPVTTLIPVQFNTKVTDPNNNYSTVTFRYTAPVTGNYGFTANLQIAVSGYTGGFAKVEVYFRHRNSSGTLLHAYEKEYILSGNTGPEGFPFNFNKNFILTSGHTIEVVLFTTGTYNATLKADGSFFKSEYTANEGGLILGDADINQYFGSEIEFERNIELSKWKTIKNSPVCDIKITNAAERMAICKIKKISRDILTGEAEFELITKSSQIGL